jgi:hypothetical protein
MAPKRATKAAPVASDGKKMTKVTKNASSNASKGKTTSIKNATATTVVVDAKSIAATARPSTRASRRLRATEDANASPLRVYEPEKRVRKTKATPSPDAEDFEVPSGSGTEDAPSDSREASVETVVDELQPSQLINGTALMPVHNLNEYDSMAVDDNGALYTFSNFVDTPLSSPISSPSSSFLAACSPIATPPWMKQAPRPRLSDDEWREAHNFFTTCGSYHATLTELHDLIEKLTNEQKAIIIIEQHNLLSAPAAITTPPRSRGFLTGVVSSVTNMFPMKRFFGNTPQAPRTEPVRRILEPVAPSKSNTATPSKSSAATSVYHQLTAVTPSKLNDATPVYHQPTAATPTSSETPPRKTYREKVAAMDAAAKRKRAAAETARAEAVIAENNRSRIAAKDAAEDAARELRKRSLAAIEATQKPGEKRKVRVDDLEVIPRPAPGVVGISDAFLYPSDESSDEEADGQESERPQAPPAKRVRFSEPEQPLRKRPWSDDNCFEKVSPHIKTPVPSMTADPHRAQPYTGTMFADKPTTNNNIFDQSDIRSDTKPRTEHVSLEDSEEPAIRSNTIKPSTEQSSQGHTSTPVSGSNTKPSTEKITTEDRLDPVAYGKKHGVWIGPKVSAIPRPANFNYEGTFCVPDDSDSETELEDSDIKTPEKPAIQPNVIALEKARNDAEKYKPKTPSGLRATSRLSASPFNGTPTNGSRFNVFGAGATPGQPATKKVPQPTAPIQAIAVIEPRPSGPSPDDMDWRWPTPPSNTCTDPEVLAAVEATVAHPDWPQHCWDEWGPVWEHAARNIPKRKDAPPIRELITLVANPNSRADIFAQLLADGSLPTKHT